MQKPARVVAFNGLVPSSFLPPKQKAPEGAYVLGGLSVVVILVSCSAFLVLTGDFISSSPTLAKVLKSLLWL